MQIYMSLRNKIFEYPAKVIPGRVGTDDVLAVLMDFTVRNGNVTAFAALDGSASLYFSNGGGFIGGIGQETIREAAKAAISVAQVANEGLREVSTYPLPSNDEVFFYVVRASGVLLAMSSGSRLTGNQDQHLKPLYNAMQSVIYQWRLFSQKKRTEPN